MTTTALAWTTLLAPLVAAALIACFTLKHRALSAALAVAGIGTGLVCSVAMAFRILGPGDPVREMHEFTWLASGGVTLKFGVLVDGLSVLMSLVVTGIGLCIFVFSNGYMKGERGWSRYFACLSLFAFSMLGIVFSTNLVETFIFWELVGVSSYSLIGYYFERPSAVEASKKAFLTNRIGDFGMTCGILLTFFTLAKAGIPGVSPSFTFTEIAPVFHSGVLKPFEADLALGAFLVFTGAMAKSAQVPLHVWLPDAMEGPTPVSALMHAATMVAAGVYLVCRTYFLFAPYEWPLHVVAGLGGATAFFAATMAFTANDVKKVLAYSTLSQLGYMTMALGLRSPSAAMFHLTTHACFKALLFLCAGAVIYGCHHEQDMRRMGGLRKKMPVTAWCYGIGALALAGIAPLSGFWSKDAILGAASGHSKPLYVVGLCVAFMTACYMGRAWWMTFMGEYRGGEAHAGDAAHAHAAPAVAHAAPAVHASHDPGHDAHGHDAHGHDAHGHDAHGHDAHGHDAHGHDAHGHDAHGHDAHGHDDHGPHGAHHGGEPQEVPWVMRGPLVVLAALSVVAGLLNIPAPLAAHGAHLEHWLMGTAAKPGPSWFPEAPPEVFHWDVAIGGTIAALLGIFIAWKFHGAAKSWSVDRFVAGIGPVHGWVERKWFFDDIYLFLVKRVQQPIADFCGFVEKRFLKEIVVDGIAVVSHWFGRQIRLLLDGHLHTYVTMALIGVLYLFVMLFATAHAGPGR
ncbi:MAG: NAD(P)H-quinone oxidoreductase subunit 2, chloroplastic [Planctomycetes bacterium]|nr:NAD(P)H-quinone oxidoreductase subunit 2, chloroplastic [Planctomycetota bacterium]